MYKNKTQRSISKSLQETYSGQVVEHSESAILSSYIYKNLSETSSNENDEQLIAKLEALDAIKDVPDKYYPAMAEIITYIHNVDKKMNLGNANA